MQNEKEKPIDIKKEMARREKRKPFDFAYFGLVLLLCLIGLIMMFSASYAQAAVYENNPLHFAIRQAIFMAIGFVIMVILSYVDYNFFKRYAHWAYAIAIVLLILVHFIGTKDANGVARSIRIGPMGIQPSEIAKVAVLLLFAKIISETPQYLSSGKLFGLIPFMLPLGFIVIMVWIEPHKSGALIILIVGAVMLFLGGIAWKYIIMVGGALTAVIASFFLFFANDYSIDRIAAWKNPFDPEILRTSGWQIVQSLYAVASGGMFGVGLGQSRQKHLYLPEAQNDFVFAIVLEELGLFGAALVLILFALLILRGYWLALHSHHDRFAGLVCAGISTMLGIQVFMNVAVVSNLIPVTGISMPFFSYGGSNLLIMMFEVGIVLSISRHIKPGIIQAK